MPLGMPNSFVSCALLLLFTSCGIEACFSCTADDLCQAYLFSAVCKGGCCWDKDMGTLPGPDPAPSTTVPPTTAPPTTAPPTTAPPTTLPPTTLPPTTAPPTTLPPTTAPPTTVPPATLPPTTLPPTTLPPTTLPPTTLPPTPATPTCEDVMPVADCIKGRDLCDRPQGDPYYDMLTSNCPKTCNRCAEFIASKSKFEECKDKVNCAQLKGLGYCTDPKQIPSMKMGCPVTCGFCSQNPPTTLPPTTLPPTQATPVCEDLLPDCVAKSYVCNVPSYYEMMTFSCPKACNRCVEFFANKSKFESCKDKVGNCAQLKGQGRCTGPPNLMPQMKMACPVTCGFC